MSERLMEELVMRADQEQRQAEREQKHSHRHSSEGGQREQRSSGEQKERRSKSSRKTDEFDQLKHKLQEFSVFADELIEELGTVGNREVEVMEAQLNTDRKTMEMERVRVEETKISLADQLSQVTKIREELEEEQRRATGGIFACCMAGGKKAAIATTPVEAHEVWDEAREGGA
mmetsp:Transcript_40185/g.106385  ORF Transcript_40185/g.106385 Transcript_40185/m.106385 type:complete len:174 (-) Transcript_40185:178-699(-)